MGIKIIRTEQEFYRSVKRGVALVEFNAPWCAPCRLQEPIINKLASVFEGRVSIYGLNVDHFQHVAADLGIHSIPTLIVFKEGKEMERIVGLQMEAVLSEALKRALGEASEAGEKK